MLLLYQGIDSYLVTEYGKDISQYPDCISIEKAIKDGWVDELGSDDIKYKGIIVANKTGVGEKYIVSFTNGTYGIEKYEGQFYSSDYDKIQNGNSFVTTGCP